MFRNYFFLNRVIVELNPIIKDLKIWNSFTQERDRLYFDISSDELPNRHLVISADQNVPFITVKKEHHRAKKNTITFFQDFFPDKIVNILISTNDRIIKLDLEKSSIFFLVRGNGTNIILKKCNELTFFKKSTCNSEELLKELDKAIYTSSFNYPKFDNLSSDIFEPKVIKSIYPFINKEILNEYKARFNVDEINFKENVNLILKDIFTQPLKSYLDEGENKIFIKPKTFQIFNKYSEIEEFNDTHTGLNGYLRKKYRFETIINHKKSVLKHLDRELNKLSIKLNQLSSRIDKGNREEDYQKIGQLLLSNYHLLKKGLNEVSPIDFETGENIKIKIDPKKTPQQNIDYYFDKSKSERINFLKSIELNKLTLENYSKYINIKKIIEESDDQKEIIQIKKDLKIKDGNNTNIKMEDSIKFKEYVLEDKYHVYVGKDSKSNDLLTVKFAKQNDYWFHARGLPGSHTVLRVENTKEVVPKNILKAAASIAAFHSKAKTAKVAPVSYTFAKFVYKKKGMAPGKVMLTKENVLLVKPEIPKNCVFMEE